MERRGSRRDAEARRGQKQSQSVVISSLGEEDAIANDPIDQPVFLGDPGGPDAAPQMFQGFWLSQAGDGVPADPLDELKDFLSMFFASLPGYYWFCGMRAHSG